MALRVLRIAKSAVTTVPINPIPFTATKKHHLIRHMTTAAGYKVEPDPQYDRSVQTNGESDYNFFTVTGPNAPLFHIDFITGYIFRCDVPGISNSDLKVSFSGRKLCISAKESKPHRFGLGRLEPRSYEAKLKLDPSVYNTAKAKAEVKNGVVWVHVPFINGPRSTKKGWCHLYYGNIHTYTNHDNGKAYIAYRFKLPFEVESTDDDDDDDE